MSKIRARNYIKCYDLYLFPEDISDEHYVYETGPEKPAENLVHLTLGFIQSLNLTVPSEAAVRATAANLLTQGGIIASLHVSNVNFIEYAKRTQVVDLDLTYTVEREVRIFAGKTNITGKLLRNRAYKFIAEKICRDLYSYHEKHYICTRKGDRFVEELFLMDNVDLVVGNSSMDITVDRPLRDYLVSLNERLKMSV